MKITADMLSQHLSQINWEDLAKILGQRGFPVDKIQQPSQHLAALRLAVIKEIAPHPNKPDVNLLTVAFHDQEKQVVCGDIALQAKQTAALILTGEHVPSTGKKLKPRDIAGITSDGMLCSASELGIASNKQGVLTFDCDPNTPIEQALFPSGAIYDIEITYNRGDMLCALGLARELASLGCGVLETPPYFASTNRSLAPSPNIHISSQECRFFSLTHFNYSEIKKHAEKINKKILPALHSISDVTGELAVDLSNFIMLTFGQPTHVFDSDQIKGKIHVRHSMENEEFTDLHANNHILQEGLLVIADDDGVIALAGVIGGLRTACTENTTNIALEIAHFNPEAVLKTQLTTNINTKAADFFTHKVNSNQAFQALSAFEFFAHTTSSKTEIAGGHNTPAQTITLTKNIALQICAETWDDAKFNVIMKKLYFEVQETSDSFIITIPHHRQDIDCPQTLLSEYLRLYGYEHINTTKHLQLQNTINPVEKSVSALFSSKYHEAKHINLVHQDHMVSIVNPLPGYGGLRSSLLPQLLNSAVMNLSKNNAFNGMFETGLAFTPNQQQNLALLTFSSLNTLQSELQMLLHEMHIDFTKVRYQHTTNPLFKEESCGIIEYKKQSLGIIGELKHQMKAKVNIFGFEINLDALQTLKPLTTTNYRPANYQHTKDYSFKLTSSQHASEILQTLTSKLPNIRFTIIDSYPAHTLTERTITIRALFTDPAHETAIQNLLNKSNFAM